MGITPAAAHAGRGSKTHSMLLGVHCSIAGGAINAFDEAKELGINTFQIFTKNQRQWKDKVIDEAEGRAFKDRQKEDGVESTFSHSMYLINLASKDPALRERSRAALVGELERCRALGLDFTVLHPGSAVDQSTTEAIDRIAEGLRHVLEATKGSHVHILLENMAGQGSTVGGKFEELKAIEKQVQSSRIGYCFDTCHAFAAGYDIRSRSAIEDTLAEWDEIIGIDRIGCFHLNDSKGTLGSRLDRHTHIGHGEIGEEAFAHIMQTYPDVPKVIETPKKDDWDRKNIEKLRDLAG